VKPLAWQNFVEKIVKMSISLAKEARRPTIDSRHISKLENERFQGKWPVVNICHDNCNIVLAETSPKHVFHYWFITVTEGECQHLELSPGLEESTDLRQDSPDKSKAIWPTIRTQEESCLRGRGHERWIHHYEIELPVLHWPKKIAFPKFDMVIDLVASGIEDCIS
jgi:hypothetical protein